MLWRCIRALLFQLPPETAHRVGGMALLCLNYILAVWRKYFQKIKPSARAGETPAPRLGLTLGGRPLANRVGIAAGFDKDGKYIPALAWLGFGFVEIGSVTPHPQAGNPPPRLFRLPNSGALINRLGFNSEGAVRVRERLARLKRDGGYPCPVGINIGKNRATPLENATADYLSAFATLYPVGDFFVVNLSSPNTPGLRQLLDENFLRPLVGSLVAKAGELARLYPGPARELFLKISPDMDVDARKRAVELALAAGFSGIIATNTSVRRDLPFVDYRDRPLLHEDGGISGRPLRELSAHHVAELRAWMGKGPKLISVGGISDAAEARRRIDAGADLVEVYTGFIYEGPGMPRRLAAALD